MAAVPISSPMAGGALGTDARDRLAQGLGTLAELYIKLHGLLVRSLRPAPSGRVRGGEPTREPISIGVLDTISMMEVTLLGLEAEVRQAHDFRPAQATGRPQRDQDGTGPDPRVVAAAGWLRKAVPNLDDDWAEYVAGIVQGTVERPGLLPMARRLLGLSERAFRPQTPCPHCGCMSLIAFRPTTGVLVCNNPDCRDGEGRQHRWSMDEWSPYASTA